MCKQGRYRNGNLRATAKSQKGITDGFGKIRTKDNCLNMIKERDPHLSLKMDG